MADERVIAGDLTRKQAAEEVSRFAGILVSQGLADQFGVTVRRQRPGRFRVIVARHDDGELPDAGLGALPA